MNISNLRQIYHQQVCKKILRIRTGKKGQKYPNFADGSNKSSIGIAWAVVDKISCGKNYDSLSGQTTGDLFEKVTCDFLHSAFALLQDARPGDWSYTTKRTAISSFFQYEHLAYIAQLVREDTTIGSAFGGNYIVTPDIVISREPITDEELDSQGVLRNSDHRHANLTPLRSVNYENAVPLLHAVISCKWTIRSDRAQNTRSEALNLLRNRKGPLPHIVALTAEPMPSRIATLALGTGDLDCVYHFALPELVAAVENMENDVAIDLIKVMVEGRRLRDISDLPFDLAI